MPSSTSETGDIVGPADGRVVTTDDDSDHVSEESHVITGDRHDEESEDLKPFVPSNSYATRKTVAQGALDFALLMANASQLKALVDIPANSRGNFYMGLLVLLGFSIALQVSAGLVLLILGMMDPVGEPAHKRAERLNNASVCLILIITIVNVFISAFGIGYVDNMPPTTTVAP